MPYAARQSSSSRLIGIAIIVALHIALIYALVTALARRNVELAHAPIETKIITETPPAPVTPPPPPPQFAPPPPPFVPPPEVNVATPPPASSSAPTAITVAKQAPAPAAPVAVAPKIDLQHSTQPSYPIEARQLGQEGTVTLKVLVDVDGRVVDAQLVQSSGFPRLDKAALDGVKSNYRFTPGTTDGKPQQMWYTLKFNWKLQS